MKKKLSKKAKIIIISCVCTLVVLGLLGGGLYVAYLYGWGALNRHDRTVYAEERELLTFREPWQADYIWIEQNGVATWAAFSKDIELEQDEPQAVLDISCDTYYWLWVNGEMIVWEGCLKRGITPQDGYYDRVTIQNKFRKGVNNVSVLVRHLGDDGFSHKDSGQGGLVVEGKIGDIPFATDGTWKGRKFAYDYSSIDALSNLNYRLSEKGSEIDGKEYVEFWSGGTEDWPNAKVLDKAYCQKTFGKSYLNPLPPKAIGETVFFDLTDRTPSGKTTLTFDLALNTQFCPYFELEADKAGRKITYYTENHLLNYKNTYTAKEGVNRFVDFAWINGQTLTVVLDKGVTLRRAGYRPTGYNAQAVGGFVSGDDGLNTLWQKAVNTLMITMRDSYMDCPDRERAQWIGDAVIESGMSFYALSPNSAALFGKAIASTYGWVHRDGVIQTVVPDGVNAYELPMQNLAFLAGCVDYIEYSGDKSVVPMVLSMAQSYLPLWEMDKGLVRHRKGSWDWGDWGNDIDVAPLENAWYYYATSRILTLVEEDSEFASWCKERLSAIKAAYPVYYKSAGVAGGKKADDRANAIAVLAGLYREEDKETIVNTLYNVRNSSPYMEKYVEQALCELGRVDLALARAKERYADMIADDGTTLWEFWKKSAGTSNHAWAGGTLYVLARYVGGVYPTTAGFDTFAVRPDTSALSDFSLLVNPVDGVEISVTASRLADGRQKLIVECTSEGGQLIVTGKRFVFNGEEIVYEANEERTFTLAIGVNELIVDSDNENEK